MAKPNQREDECENFAVVFVVTRCFQLIVDNSARSVIKAGHFSFRPGSAQCLCRYSPKVKLMARPIPVGPEKLGAEDLRDEVTPERSSGALSRRELLQRMAGVLALTLTPLSAVVGSSPKHKRLRGRKRWPKPPAGVRRNPRYRRKKSQGYATKLSPGFYRNTRSQVIHYVGNDGRIARVNHINESRLRPVAVNELVQLGAINSSAGPHVNFSVASHALEKAALARIQAGDKESASRLLLQAIRHDQFFKLGTREDASLRLYDLLAGLSLRYNQPETLSEVVRLTRAAQQQMGQPRRRSTIKGRGRRRIRAGAAPQKTRRQPSAFSKWQKENKRALKTAHEAHRRKFFETRLRKWAAADSPWKRRWRDTARPMQWKQGNAITRLALRKDYGAGVLK